MIGGKQLVWGLLSLSAVRVATGICGMLAESAQGDQEIIDYRNRQAIEGAIRGTADQMKEDSHQVESTPPPGQK